jgi:hypothetical protein
MAEGSILFWNVQRLSGNSDQERQSRIVETLKSQLCDLNILCEMMQSYTGFAVSAHTYGAVSGHTLGYSAVDKGGNDVPISAVDAEVPDCFSGQVKGGLGVDYFLNRKLVEVDHNDASWPRVFMIHTNAARGAACTTIAASTTSNLGGDWLLIGDFNDDPDDIITWLNWAGIKTNVFMPDGPTHVGPAPNYKESKYDYVISSPSITNVVINVLRRRQSDHDPIKIRWQK